jgi:hypothetical protein
MINAQNLYRLLSNLVDQDERPASEDKLACPGDAPSASMIGKFFEAVGSIEDRFCNVSRSCRIVAANMTCDTSQVKRSWHSPANFHRVSNQE